jgi:acetyltransferase-like isoleucine patch superfamily enzyme
MSPRGGVVRSAGARVWDRLLRGRIKGFVRGPMAPLIRRVLKSLLLEYHLIYGDPDRLKLPDSARVNNALFNTVSGHISVGENVFFGFNVCILTGTHDYTRLDQSRQDAILDAVNDISIGDGAWLATNVTVIGPCRIGEWAVVAAGALVREDVPAYTVVAGTPARVVKQLERPSGSY